MKYRSQAQKDAQINAMEAARGAAAKRARAKEEAAREDAANQSRVEFIPPRNPDRFMPVWRVRVIDRDGLPTSSREFYSEDEARDHAEEQGKFTRRGVKVFDWDTECFVTPTLDI